MGIDLSHVISLIENGELDDDLKEIMEVSERIQKAAKARKVIVDYREYAVGDEFEGKDHEYTIVAKTRDEQDEDFIYTVKIHKFGEEACEYQVFKHDRFKGWKKTN